MPLDMFIQPTLTDRLNWIGFHPVPDVVLEQHKTAELIKHPASWWFQRIAPLRFGILSTMLGSILVTLLLESAYVGAVVLACMVAVMGVDLIRFKGPAEWREVEDTNIVLNTQIPVAIRQLAIEVREHVGGTYVLGELIQKRMVLDPYLLVRSNDGTVCIGIWDGDTVLHIATR